MAPVSFRSRFTALVDRETEHAAAGRPARIIIKNNALTDIGIVKTLYRASQAGVCQDLIVRGACALRPGLPGVSDRIRVRSVVGRFLEHSRIYCFENGGVPDMYIGSADLMERNLDRRVEALCRILDPHIARHLRDVVLDTYLKDNDRAYVLGPDGYERVARPEGEAAVSAQDALLAWYTRPTVDDPS